MLTSTVYALYPESNQRTLEEMNLLFAASTPWSWDAEKSFAMLQADMGNIGGRTRTRGTDIEAKGNQTSADHNEK